MQTKIVHVAVGVVLNNQGQVLLSKRAQHQHQGGLWEFPGGKLEADEGVFDALVREFAEEVGIHILEATPLLSIQHDYGDKQVLLDVWLSREFTGEAVGKEQQLIKWVSIPELGDYAFPEANKAIVSHLQKLVL